MTIQLDTTSESRAALLDRLREQGVRYLFGAYVDAHGVPKSKCVPVDYLDSMAQGSELYTVGALEGMGELGPNEDECLGIPDLSRLVVLPWDRRFAVAPADLEHHGRPYTHDSRGVLKRQLAAAAELGYAFNVGVEPEVYVLRNVDGEWTAVGRRGPPQRADARLRPRGDDPRGRVPGADGRPHDRARLEASTPSTTRAATGSTSSSSATPTRSRWPTGC